VENGSQENKSVAREPSWKGRLARRPWCGQEHGPSCCLHCLWGVRGRRRGKSDAERRRGAGPAAGRGAGLSGCGWRLQGWRQRRGAGRRGGGARREGQCAARALSQRGLPRARARPGSAPGTPAAGGRPAPVSPPWRPTVSALGGGGPGEAAARRVGSSPRSGAPAFVRARGSGAGTPSPRAALAQSGPRAGFRSAGGPGSQPGTEVAERRERAPGGKDAMSHGERGWVAGGSGAWALPAGPQPDQLLAVSSRVVSGSGSGLRLREMRMACTARQPRQGCAPRRRTESRSGYHGQ
jgi:hypothetical protein